MSQSLQEQPLVFLARQPIYDRKMKVYAYELLYRRQASNSAGKVGLEESAATLVRAIVEIGLDKLVGDKPAYVNIPGYLLSDPAIELLPPERVVLEILEDTEPTTETLQAASQLASKGYKLALDDFVFGSAQIEFLPFCKTVKVDVLANKRNLLKACVDILKPARVRLLAEKVEDMPMYAKCQAMGFNYFQGYFFAKPEIVSGRGVPSVRAVLIHLLTRLQDPDVTMDELERLVSADVSLTYRLLKIVNTVCVAPGEYVESVRSALVLLGLAKVVSLVSLLTLAGVDDKPAELMVTAMIRAKMCQEVADVFGYHNSEKHFTVGLLSVLEAMFDVAMEDILSQLPLSPDLKDALTNPYSVSPLAEVLKVVLAFETGDWVTLEANEAHAPMIINSYVTAVGWADDAKLSLAA